MPELEVKLTDEELEIVKEELKKKGIEWGNGIDIPAKILEKIFKEKGIYPDLIRM